MNFRKLTVTSSTDLEKENDENPKVEDGGIKLSSSASELVWSPSPIVEHTGMETLNEEE